MVPSVVATMPTGFQVNRSDPAGLLEHCYAYLLVYRRYLTLLCVLSGFQVVRYGYGRICLSDYIKLFIQVEIGNPLY